MLDNMINHDTSKVLVSIKCYAYNHEKFIRQCLDGFVMQKTTFRFEAVVHDDASTDGTAKIIREYAEKYPDIIIPVLEAENQYSKHDGSLGRAMARAVSKDSKYYAFCEGDDYWIDPEKLQKQVDYLESHPECSMVFTNAIMKWEDNSRPDKLFSELKDRDYSGLEIFEDWIIPTASVVMRKDVNESDLHRQVFTNKKISAVGDTPLFMTCARLGLVHAFPAATCVYRRHSGGYLMGADSNRKIQLGDFRYETYKVFGPEYKRSAILTALTHYRVGLWHAMHEKNYRNVFRIIGRFLKIYSVHPAIGYLRIKQIIKEKKANKSSY